MSNFNNNDYNNLNENNYGYETNNKKNKKPKKAIAGVVSLAIASSLIGGIAGGTGVYTVLKDRDDVKESVKTEQKISTGENSIVETGTTSNTASVVKKVAPAVVGVSTKSIVSTGFFNVQEQEGIGSGFIIDEEGKVITNYHVIQGASEVKVILSTGEEVNAKVINSDSQMDVALLQITDKNIKLPGIAQLGDSSKVSSGEDVIAIGNPLGKEFSSTVTKGIVSSANRKISVDGSKENVVDYIQTDAAINPGNSGGPLINSAGQVIGINTAKKVGEEIEGIGFSIPINKVKDKLDVLSKPELKIGISGRDVTEEIIKAQELRGNKLEKGIYVVEVEAFSPAEKAGIKAGDLIVSFNGKNIESIQELNELKGKLNAKDIVKVGIIREGKKLNLELTLVTK
ncbi:S1C family serine protease [Clostridium sp.]|uniref:S1C family serine protease n=1 Tax=Clostridium sp. TaxID=1506 RepID=UPI0039931CCA